MRWLRARVIVKSRKWKSRRFLLLLPLPLLPLPLPLLLKTALMPHQSVCPPVSSSPKATWAAVCWRWPAGVSRSTRFKRCHRSCNRSPSPAFPFPPVIDCTGKMSKELELEVMLSCWLDSPHRTLTGAFSAPTGRKEPSAWYVTTFIWRRRSWHAFWVFFNPKPQNAYQVLLKWKQKTLFG